MIGLNNSIVLIVSLEILLTSYIIPDVQNNAIVRDFTSCKKSLLIADNIPAKSDHDIKNINIISIYKGNCNQYISGANPYTTKITITIAISIKFISKSDRLINVGIVATGNFIFVTKYLYFLIEYAPSTKISFRH